MPRRPELRLFRTVVSLVLLIPGIAGPVGGFLGIPALARLLQAAPPVLDPSIHNSLRAVCWMFFSLVPVVGWTLIRLREGALVFRMVVACAVVAGLARLTGYFVDGWPGWIPMGIMAIELGLMPILLAWHARLLAPASP